MGKLNIGVIGAGFMGEMHARIFNDLPNSNLVGIVDIDSALAKNVADSIGAKSFGSIEEMLSEDGLHAVSICVSDAHHLEPVMAACKSGKHIFLEKPVATTMEDAYAIAKAVKEHNVRMTVGHLLRLDNKYDQLKRYVQSDGLGHIISINTRRNSPISDGPKRYGKDGCLTLHVAVHDMDLILWVMQKKVQRVYAERASIALKELGIDDVVCATLKFEDGSIASLQYNWVLPNTFPTHIDAKMEVIGTRGYAAVDFADQGLWVCDDSGFRWPDTAHWPTIRGSISGDLREELAAFVDALLNNKEFAISVDEAVESVRLALAVMRSLDEERVIEL